ncbi:hypothetical protein [Microbacterium cremeum]|uniref:hypothetical protein n=1 Tax=Microbacterium cremeum TaxID=2782169 RepID=UPI001888576D|nr:hypothetical protein [Microbacterium cremeum]
MASPRSVFASLWWGAIAVLGVSVLFAPIITYGWFADGVEGGTSMCGSSQHSVVGIPSSMWMWIGSMVAVVIVTAVLAIRRQRHRERIPLPYELEPDLEQQ